MKLFFSVGEPSGDLHGANLVRALRLRLPDCECVGFGGPRMAAAGCRLDADLTRLSVMWLWGAIVNLGRFLRLLRQADRAFAMQRPDAVVLIDYPGFNWWVARRAKARGIPVIYYGAPQLWAWASYRVAKMRRLVDHVLCKLPFEQTWFRERGCRATYVGHPYFDELRARRIDAAFVSQVRHGAQPLVTILPGSRMQEVTTTGPALFQAARQIAGRVGRVRFVVAAFNETQAEVARRLAAQANVAAEVHVGRTPELIHAADVCLACSGSVSLELLFHAKPSVVVYQTSRLGFFLQRWVRRVRYITLVNLLTAEHPIQARPAQCYDPADPRDAHVLLPEYLTATDRSQAVADHAIGWLTDPASRAARSEALARLRSRVAHEGASERAADYILRAVARSPQSVRRPAEQRSRRRAA